MTGKHTQHGGASGHFVKMRSRKDSSQTTLKSLLDKADNGEYIPINQLK